MMDPGVLIGVAVLLLLAGAAYFTLRPKKKSVEDEKTTDIDVTQSGVKADTVTEEITQVDLVVPTQDVVRAALANTGKSFWGRFQQLLATPRNEVLEHIEELLYGSDLGPKAVERLMERLREKLDKPQLQNAEEVKKVLKSEMGSILNEVPAPYSWESEFSDRIRWNKDGPTILLIVGVNGAGKTTTIGKLSAQLARRGKRVLVAAGDTFRAAASAQLKTWTERAQVEIFSPPRVTDPSAVAFEAVTKAKSQKFDAVLIDTAGRLHNQAHLMEELKKVKRVIEKILPGAPHDIWIVLDANSGQNALVQAKEFHQALGLTGVVLTKLDGTAKGGVVIGVAEELKLPIVCIGVGEKLGDLKEFNPNEFLDSILYSPS